MQGPKGLERLEHHETRSPLRACPSRVSTGRPLGTCGLPVQSFLEWAKQVGILFELGEFPAPAAHELDVQPRALATNDPGHVHEVLRARRDQFVDDEVLGGAGTNDDARRELPGRRVRDGVNFERKCGQRDINPDGWPHRGTTRPPIRQAGIPAASSTDSTAPAADARRGTGAMTLPYRACEHLLVQQESLAFIGGPIRLPQIKQPDGGLPSFVVGHGDDPIPALLLEDGPHTLPVVEPALHPGAPLGVKRTDIAGHD